MSSLHLSYVLYALFFLLLAVSVVAHRSLFNSLKLYDTPTWEALGRPELKIGFASAREQSRFNWYILSLNYRRSGIRNIKRAGDISFGCIIGLCLIGVGLITFGR